MTSLYIFRKLKKFIRICPGGRRGKRGKGKRLEEERYSVQRSSDLHTAVPEDFQHRDRDNRLCCSAYSPSVLVRSIID